MEKILLLQVLIHTLIKLPHNLPHPVHLAPAIRMILKICRTCLITLCKAKGFHKNKLLRENYWRIHQINFPLLRHKILKFLSRMGLLKRLPMLQSKLNLQWKNYQTELLLSSQLGVSCILEKVKERGRRKIINRSKCYKKLIKPEMIGIVMIL